MFPFSVGVGDLFFRKTGAEELERINEGQITRESVEEILSFGNAAKLCPKEFVAEIASQTSNFKSCWRTTRYGWPEGSIGKPGYLASTTPISAAAALGSPLISERTRTKT